jgi:hypothetical protein
MRIYLLRHGESLDDIEDAYGGIADYPLTEAADPIRCPAKDSQEKSLQVTGNQPAKFLQTGFHQNGTSTRTHFPKVYGIDREPFYSPHGKTVV